MSKQVAVMGRSWATIMRAMLAAPVMLVRHLRRRWWAQAPYLPTFSQEHLDWRKATAYGSPSHDIEVGDLVDYLAWTRRYGRATR
jgi:hypothetical protein